MAPKIEVLASILFASAILHTFCAGAVRRLAKASPRGSVREILFHLLGEVEISFGFWAAIFLLLFALHSGFSPALAYLESLRFHEPLFVFVILVVCATRPVLRAAGGLIETIAALLPLPGPLGFYVAALILGPLSGSWITEPAAMTVTALLLRERFYRQGISASLMYATIALLFVCVSIGGTLTPYAAPPVLMVAKKWDWDLVFMLKNFGGKAILAIVVSVVATALCFRRELVSMAWPKANTAPDIPVWVSLAHFAFVGLIVASAHHPVLLVGLFVFFLGLTAITKRHQEKPQFREAVLVAFFLGGLVVLGGPQRWWLEPLVKNAEAFPLYLGGIGLTAVIDNAALTYLGSLVPGLGEHARYALVAGSVVGGGLTVIANAPNPAGYGILQSSFGREGINPGRLFLYALPPTFWAGLCFWLL